MATTHDWQLELTDLKVTNDQEGDDEPYFVLFGIRATPEVPGSTHVFWAHYLDDNWADGIVEGGEKPLPWPMGSLAFPAVTTVSADEVHAGTAPELVGFVGVAFESDKTAFRIIREAMNDCEKVIADALRTHVEQAPFNHADPDASLPAIVGAVQAELDQNMIETIISFFWDLFDPDDIIGIEAQLFVAGDASLAAEVTGVPVLRQQPLQVTFSGDGATYVVTGHAIVGPGPGRAMPATVEAAEADQPRRTANLLRAWGLRLQYRNKHVLPEWDADKDGGGRTALRIIAAGMATFAAGDTYGPTEWASFSGLDPAVADRQAHLDAFHDLVRPYLDTVKAFAWMGTDVSCKGSGDYDFLLRDIMALITMRQADTDVLPNDMVRRLLLQPVPFLPGGPAVPFAGTDIDQWASVGGNGKHFFRVNAGDWAPVLPFLLKVSVAETENHLLGIWAWRFLLNEYLVQVASQPGDRFDPELKAVLDADPDRYTNTAQVKDWVLQLIGRFVHSGAFESNARPYSAIAMNALFAFLGSRDPQVSAAARNALDYLAAEFAFQSFEGKRMAPIRRNVKHQTDVGFYDSDYVADIFGVLTGAYVFSDDIGADRTPPVVCPHTPADQYCDVCSGAPLDQPCWAAPYHWTHIDQNGGFALWAVLSGYTVPAAIHDFMLNKHGGYFSRIQTRYARESFPLPHIAPGLMPDFAVEPDPARARYFQDVAAGEATPADYDVPGRGDFKPVSQSYFAAPTYLNSAGGRTIDFYQKKPSDLLPVVGPSLDPAVQLLWLRLRDLLDEKAAENKQLHDIDVYSRPTAIIPRGNVRTVHGEDITALERLLPTMRGRDAFQGSQNLATYKSLSIGYTYDPDDDESRHNRFPQRYPASWDDYRVNRGFGIGRAAIVVFDFTAEEAHPLGGHYWVMGRVGKNDGDAPYRRYGRGWWEVVPGHRFATGADLAAHIQKVNPDDHFDNDVDNHYKYRMASSGELVEFHNGYGSSQSDQAFLRITGADGENVPLDRYVFDLRDPDSLRRTPLLDVWQTDRDYGFTGQKYAQADGHGRVTVHNPFLAQTLTLDSSDYRAPSRAVTTGTVATIPLPAAPGPAGEVPNVGAMVLGGGLLWATHFYNPAPFQPSTVPGELLGLDPRTGEVRRQVEVGREPMAIGRHEATGRLFVVNYRDRSVTVVDSATGTVLATLPGEPGWGMQNIAVSQRHDRVYVPQAGQSHVLVYDPHTLELVGTLTGLPLSGGIAVDDAADRLFVLVTNAADASRQDLVEFGIGRSGPTELRRVTLAGQVSRQSELAVDAERCHVLTATPGTPDGQQLVVVDRRSFGVLGTVPLDSNAVAVAASASQRVVYVATHHRLVGVDVASRAVLRRVDLPYAPHRTLVAEERTGLSWLGGAGSSVLTRLDAAPELGG